MQSNNDKFKKIYAEAVGEAMSILGEGTSIVTKHLEQKYSINLADTVDNPKLLSEALESAISGGNRVIQRRILRLLYEKINHKPPPGSVTEFEQQIVQAREEYERRI